MEIDPSIKSESSSLYSSLAGEYTDDMEYESSTCDDTFDADSSPCDTDYLPRRSIHDFDPMTSVGYQQKSMERVVAELSIDDRMRFMDDNGNYLPIFEWEGLHFNWRKEVVSVRWGWYKASGSIDLQYFPPTVQEIRIVHFWHVLVRGMSSLPPTLAVLDIHAVRLKNEELHMENLPRTLEYIDISRTGISGELDFSKCPPGLRVFRGSWNNFIRGFNSRQLPIHIEEISLEHNRLSGIYPKLDKLPKSLEFLRLSHNEFSGRAVVRDLHDGIKEILLEGNKFDRYSVYGEVPRTLKEIRVGYNETVEGRTYAGNGCIFQVNHTYKNLLDFIPQCEKKRKKFY